MKVGVGCDRPYFPNPFRIAIVHKLGHGEWLYADQQVQSQQQTADQGWAKRMKFCKLADILDWQDPEFEATGNLLLLGDRNRKTWKFIHVYRGLQRLGQLNSTTRILGLGVGHECLIYAFTNVCDQVVATDLHESQSWETAAMTAQEVYDHNPFPYQRDRLTVQPMDMTRLGFPDASFDCVWSCCAIEHVNNFRDLHQVYAEIHRVLKPGGIAALTTEFNMTDRPSYEPNMLFTDRHWTEAWLTGPDPLVQGFELIDLPDFAISDDSRNQPMERKGLPGAMQIYCNDVVLNSVAFFLRKSGEFSRAYDETWLTPFWRDYLTACVAYRAGDYGNAETLLRQQLQEPLESRLKVRASRRLADALYAQNQLDAVRQVCEAVLPDCQIVKDEDQLMPLAFYCSQTGLTEAAQQLYQIVEQLPSTLPGGVIRSLLNQAKYYEQKQQFDKALERVGRAEQLIPPGSDLEQQYKSKVYFRTGFSYEKMGQLSVAIRFYQLAIELSQSDVALQTKCYRRLTTCLQTQVKQLTGQLDELKAAHRGTHNSRLRQLRSIWGSLEARWKR
jgi:tetratricopeptide (TPR) repeat protein/2-polyprenyl-3-methyl-5-hydroxy-6-metoxy-1,4-benzoquinol methylase